MTGQAAHGGARWRSRASAVLRILVSAVLLGVILHFIPLDDVWAHISTMSPLLWFAVFAAFLAGHALLAAKWRWMIGSAISYPRALKAHLAGLAANLALPGVATGDIVRAGMVMKSSGKKAVIGVGSLADRLIDTAALVVVAAMGAVWLGASAGIDPAPFIASAVCAAALIAVSIAALGPAARFLGARPRPGRLGASARKLGGALEELSERRWTLLASALLSVAVQAAFAVLNALIAINLGAGTSMAAWLFAWPLAKLIATLPISVGGLGVREASLAGLMAPLGYPAAGVVAASLVWQSVLYAAGGTGALAQTLWRREPPASASALGAADG